MTKTQTSLPSDEVLRKAANLLQRAHDNIEIFGFNIDTFGTGNKKPESDRYEQTGPACYIGSLRLAAGVKPSPGAFDIAAEGDGPELIEALKIMDGIAKRRMKPKDRRTVKSDWKTTSEFYRETTSTATEYPADLWSVGRFVEQFGFEVQSRAEEKFEDQKSQREYEKNYALKLLRKALTEIHTRLGVE